MDFHTYTGLFEHQNIVRDLRIRRILIKQKYNSICFSINLKVERENYWMVYVD